MHVIATSAGARTRRRRSGVGWGGVLTREDRALLERAPGSSCVALLRGINGESEGRRDGGRHHGSRRRRKTRESGTSEDERERVIICVELG